MVSPPDHLPPQTLAVCLKVTLEYSSESIVKLSVMPPFSYLTLSTVQAPVLGAICRTNG